MRTAWAPVRNDRNDIVGWEQKAPKEHPLDERSFSRLAKDSDRGITRMGERDLSRVKVVYTGEATIDLLTQWQRDGRPAGAVICSMSGNPTERARQEISDLVAKAPAAKVNIVTDNDAEKFRIDWRNKVPVRQEPPGDKFAADIEAAIRAKVPDADIERRRPGAAFKDVNDEHRGITKADAEAAFEKVLARCESPEASSDDRRRAAEIRDKQHERETAKSLYNALSSGRMTADEVRGAIEQLDAARNDRSSMERLRAEAAAEAARKAAEEEARRNAKYNMKEAAVASWVPTM